MEHETRLTVLIVDDSVVVRERLRALLSEVEGVRVVGEAAGIREARTAVRAVRPDVVILDVRMPDGSGIDLLADLKREVTAPRVIVLTNYPHPQYRRRCLDAGAELFLDKSAEFHRVAEALSGGATEEPCGP